MDRFKKIIFLLISVFVALFMQSVEIYGDSPVKVMINGAALVTDTPAVTKDNRTLVPFRAIFESLGAKVEWVEPSGAVIGTKEGINIMMAIGSKNIRVNGVDYQMDVAPTVINNRTMVPVRFVSEHMGERVDWDSITNTVYIGANNSDISAIFGGETATTTPTIPVSPVTPSVITQKDLLGTFAMQDISQNQYILNLKADGTLDIKNITRKLPVSTGTYANSGNTFTLKSPLISSTYKREDFTYEGKNIILMRDTSGNSTFAITPIEAGEYNSYL